MKITDRMKSGDSKITNLQGTVQPTTSRHQTGERVAWHDLE
jgi:hypothetical protein